MTEILILVCSAVAITTAAALIAYDIRYSILPDILVALLGVSTTGLLLLGAPFMPSAFFACMAAALGFIVFLAVRHLVSRWKNREAMGLGDVKLVLPLGLFLGLDFGLGLMAACLLQVAVFLFVPPDAEVPFGPALIAGTAFILLLRVTGFLPMN